MSLSSSDMCNLNKHNMYLKNSEVHLRSNDEYLVPLNLK